VCVSRLDEHDPLGISFRGWALGFAPQDACSPLLTLTMLDGERSGQPPFKANLTDRLCNGSALHNVSLFVELGEDCRRLDSDSSGLLSVDDAATFETGTSAGPQTYLGNANAGLFDGAVRRADGVGSPVPLTFTFAFENRPVTMNLQGLYPDLCAPPTL